jgi:hypothetical protein
MPGDKEVIHEAYMEKIGSRSYYVASYVITRIQAIRQVRKRYRLMLSLVVT